MKDPIKIIQKFKNNNKRIQYKLFIFIGSLVPSNILKILESIQKKDFYTTLNILSKGNYKELEDYYGKYWYEKFFISYHIYTQRNSIINTPVKKKTIESKYGRDWFNTHIVEPPSYKVPYSYASMYYDLQVSKGKIKSKIRRLGIDFRTNANVSKVSAQDINKDIITLEGGNDDNKNIITLKGGNDDDIDNDIDKDEISDDEDIKPMDQVEEVPDEIKEEIKDEIIEEELNDKAVNDLTSKDLSDFYSVGYDESAKEVDKTANMISTAINDKKWEKKADTVEKNYDDKLDNISFDNKLDDIYYKYYITDMYIFKDDTIKTLRNKLSISIPMSEKFGKSMKMLPETMYFWCEYNFEKKNEAVMLGQKWIRKNELVNIDIIPNENIKVYEKLHNNLSYLKDSFGYKIKREDDEQYIIRSYEDFITMNEIYMIDIYNELGTNYNPDVEEKRNVYDVYVNIYFPLISYERLEQIIQLLSGKNDKELTYIETQYGSIRNDTKLEYEISNIVEETKLNKHKYEKFFEETHIIQFIIHINTNNPKNITGTTSNNIFNLYRIFDNFIVSKKYPFIQYQTTDIQVVYKFYNKYNKTDYKETLSKWFENMPYGISFKVRMEEDKYISINLHENGKMDYKVTWKEEDNATDEDIVDTYEYVKDLLKKINSENTKVKFIIPQNENFKYAFINTIQKFNIPDKFKINHDDLSDFCRFFFTYVSLVLEPKKRISKANKGETFSKYGTYLRYRRIANFENKTRMHLRILYFLRNYDINDKELISEIANQFNIIDEVASKELDFVREKYHKIIVKSKKLQTKLKVMPKYKPPGIGIDIQGRDTDRYKIRITGARDKHVLDDMIDFIKVLIYLYIETYLYKKKEFQKLKDMLKNLTKIAKRRNKVIAIVDNEKKESTIKNIIALDKSRLGFKPEKGQSQWSRSCQNSGDKNRQPSIISSEDVERLIKEGYRLNEKTGLYEKDIDIKIKNKTYNTIIKAVKLSSDDKSFNYYTCDPIKNKEYMYIGFLARGNNPNNLCMPCCYKKDQNTGNNKQKKNYYQQCIGEKAEEIIEKALTTNVGDKIYILQETNKVQEGRFIVLPKYLEIFFNKIWNHDNKIRNHYLTESKSGYFFKYTVKHDNLFFLVAISNIFEIPIEKIIEKMLIFLENDKTNKYFIYLNNGDIAKSFVTKEKYIDFIKTSDYLEYDIVGELISLPGVITEKGINFYILNKKTIITKKTLEKEETKEKYYLDCLNYENFNEYIKDKDIVLLIKEDKYYFPIYRVQKNEKVDKKIKLEKYYNKNKQIDNIIKELNNYHTSSCKITISYASIDKNLFAKNIIEELKIKKIEIIKQYIDDINKCRYLELDLGIIIPIRPSGISYNFNFAHINTLKNKWLNLKDTIKLLEKVNNKIKINYIPKSVFYDEKKQSNIRIISILLQNNLIIPIKNEVVTENSIKRLGLSILFQQLEETVNKELEETKDELDKKHLIVNQRHYINESYNLFRLEFSLYLNENPNIKKNIIDIVRNNNINKSDKKNELRKILLRLIDSKTKNHFINIVNELPDLKSYISYNAREYCKTINNKDKCISNVHCNWKNNSCNLQILESTIIDFISKIIEEMIQDGIKFKELIQEFNYYVSDIINQHIYTNRDEQIILKDNNYNINKLMAEFFEKDKMPTIGKKSIKKIEKVEEEDQELIELGKQYIQKIIPNKDSVIRAYVNSYFWINNPLYDIESRNLGYFNILQTNLAYLFKANIIDFIKNHLYNNDKNNSDIKKFLEKYFKYDNNLFDSQLNKFRKSSINTNGIIELYALSYLITYPIVVYDNLFNIKYTFFQGDMNVTKDTLEKNKDKTIFIKFDFDNYSIIPKTIYAVYNNE